MPDPAVLCVVQSGKLSMRNRTLADMIHTLRIINIHDNFRHCDVIAHKFFVYAKMRELYNLWMKMNLSRSNLKLTQQHE